MNDPNWIIYGYEQWGVGERLVTLPETHFHTDSNKLLFVLIALILMEISADFDWGGKPLSGGSEKPN